MKNEDNTILRINNRDAHEIKRRRFAILSLFSVFLLLMVPKIGVSPHIICQ